MVILFLIFIIICICYSSISSLSSGGGGFFYYYTKIKNKVENLIIGKWYIYSDKDMLVIKDAKPNEENYKYNYGTVGDIEFLTDEENNLYFL